jgi:glycerol-3-phosphate acyltransferase PlsX
MGGDFAPAVVVEGAEIALVRYPNLKFILFGDEAALKPLLVKHPKVAGASRVVHSDKTVSMSDKPSEAVRRGRQTSMWMTVNAVRQGEAQAAVSAGNTGALMAMSKVQLKTMPGISRPAIAAIWPTTRGESIVLDLGANLEADEKQLVDFAILGEAFAHVELGLESPSVGLLNIGEEELKGHDEIRNAANILRENVPQMNFAGFVEGSDIGSGKVDVIVTDGFTGNVALKTAEGTARQFAGYMRSAMQRTLRSRIGALFAANAFRAMKAKMDPRSSNGGVFLGLNGLVIKSHGGTDGLGFAAALDVAIDMADSDFEARARERLAELETHLAEKAENESEELVSPVVKQVVES